MLISFTRTTTAPSPGSHEMAHADIRMNGGFFVFKRDVIDCIEPGEELVEKPFARLIAAARASRLPLRRVLPADGHDQGPPDARVASRFRGRALAPPAFGSRGRCWSCRRLTLRAACSRSAVTPTTSKSGAGGHCSRSFVRTRSSRSTGSSWRHPASGAPRLERARRHFSREPARRASTCTSSGTASCPMSVPRSRRSSKSSSAVSIHRSCSRMPGTTSTRIIGSRAS